MSDISSVPAIDEIRAQLVAAVAYCLASTPNNPSPTNADIDAYRADAAWALRDADVPAGRGELTVAIVMGGATRIKGYVFESARLHEIRGASGLLDRINLNDLPALWHSNTGLVRCTEAVIYANGGEILAFAPAHMGAIMADAIERCYTEETLVAQSVAVSRTYTLAEIRDGLAAGKPSIDNEGLRRLLGYNPVNATFGSIVTPLAVAKYRRREGNADADPNSSRSPRDFAHFETIPFGRLCDSCDRRNAVILAPISPEEDEPQRLCQPCARKRVYGQLAKTEDKNRGERFLKAVFGWQPGETHSWATRFESWLLDHSDDRGAAYYREYTGYCHTPQDLNDIAKAATPRGYVGVIYADGNNMGALIEGLKTAPEYRRFAVAVHNACQTAVYSALASNLHPATKLDEEGKQYHYHPFEILSIGGDDLMLIVPAHAALEIACHICDKVESYLLEHAPDQFLNEASYEWEQVHRSARRPDTTMPPQCKVSMSVGVALAPQFVPVYYLQDLASKLLKSAKAKAKTLKERTRYAGGTIDFLSLKSTTMPAESIKAFRDAALTGQGGGHLYGRPYTVAETRALLDSADILVKCSFPRGQLYRLCEALRKGTMRSLVDYLYFFSRQPKLTKAREAIEALWPTADPTPTHPWRVINPVERDQGTQGSHEWETIWPDIAELLDFAAQATGGSNADSEY